MRPFGAQMLYDSAVESEHRIDRRDAIDALRELRLRLGLTQADVGDRMLVSQRTLSTFERQSTEPLVSSLQRYAHALGARVVITIEPPEGLTDES